MIDYSRYVVDLSGIRANYQLVKDRVGHNVEIAPSVKAECYGIGVIPVLKALLPMGVKSCYVKNLDEALEIRQQIPSLTIYVFDGVQNLDEARLCKNYNFIPVINSPKQLDITKAVFDDGYVIFVDTNMARLGFTETEITKHLNEIKDKAALLISHFSASDILQDHTHKMQFEMLQEVAKGFSKARLSISNSGGVFLNNDYHLDQVRTGAVLYGINSTHDTNLPIKNVVSLFSEVLQIREVDRAQGVGYNSTFEAQKGMRLATLKFGYYDGIRRSLSNKGYAFYKGYLLPFVGVVSMDYTVIDVTSLPERMLNEIKSVELLGENIKLNQMALLAGTIPYEILTSLKPRCIKVYND